MLEHVLLIHWLVQESCLWWHVATIVTATIVSHDLLKNDKRKTAIELEL